MSRKEAKLNKVDIEHLKLMIKISSAEDIASDFNHQIDKIYDDFESRTCEDCRYWKYEEDNHGHCGKLYTFSRKTFGCNKFERKIG